MATKLTQELSEEQTRAQSFKEEISKYTKRMDEQQIAIDDSERENFELMRKKDELQTKRNDLWRNETQLTQEVSQMKDEMQRCEQSLRSVTGRNVLQGIESIRTLINQFKTEKKNLDIVEGYHGLLIDNIKCDKSLYTAVETAVGGRLFYHIVDSDAIVMRLLKIFNQQKMPGDVNYYPLNVLKPEQNIKYPETQDAIPLISKVEYDPKMEKAIHSVFDRVLLCRNPEVATHLARQNRMDCVLLDGDFTSRKGALTGGYVDTRQSKLAYYGQKLELSEQIKVKDGELSNIQADIRHVDAQLNSVLNDLQKHETRNKRNKDTYEQMKSDLQSRKSEIDRLERMRPQKLRSIESLNADISRFTTSKELYQVKDLFFLYFKKISS